MKVIGLTGGIGSGKSTVSRFLAELGAVILNADEIGHDALKRGTEISRQISAAFGRQVLTPGGDIDRRKLGAIIFKNDSARKQLDLIMHPRMYEMVRVRLEDYRRQGTRVVVLEAPLLLEAGWTSLVDEIWVTVAPESKVLKRLQERAGLSAPEALARIRSQMPSEERAKHADVIIDTDCDLAELKSRVKILWQRLQGECE